MSTIHFDTFVHTYVTRERDSDDEWDRDSTDGDVSIVGAVLVSKDGYDCLSVDKELKAGDKVWLVWAQFGMGDSFGSDGGNYELLEVCTTPEEAQKRKAHFEQVTDHSVPWSDYFGWLDGVYVNELTLTGETT